jgi:hypothetical protein
MEVPPTSPHGVTTQQTTIDIFTNMRISHLREDCTPEEYNIFQMRFL